MSQSLAKILVHIIFSTKNRFAFLADNDIRSQMDAYLATVFKVILGSKRRTICVGLNGLADGGFV